MVAGFISAMSTKVLSNDFFALAKPTPKESGEQGGVGNRGNRGRGGTGGRGGNRGEEGINGTITTKVH